MNLTTAVSSADVHQSYHNSTCNSSTTDCADDDLVNNTEPTFNPDDGLIMANSNYLLWLMIAQIILTIILNGTIIVVVACEKRLRKPANAYMFSNACNDLIIASIPMVGIAQNTLSAEWRLGDAFCYMVGLCDAACSTVELTHVFLMAYDRYLAILRPLEYSKPNRKLVIGIHISLAYAVSFVAWTPPLVLYSPKDAYCYIVPPPHYESAQFFLLYYSYISAVIYLYVSCMRGLWSQYFKVRPQKVVGGLPSGHDKADDLRSATISLKSCGQSSIACITNENHSQLTFVDVSMSGLSTRPQDKLTPVERSAASNPSENVVHMSKQTNKRRNDLVRSLRNVGIYAGAFLILTFPYANLVIFCDIFDANRCDDYAAFQIISCVPYYHSFVHPTLYILTQRDFRASAKQLVLKLCRRLKG